MKNTLGGLNRRLARGGTRGRPRRGAGRGTQVSASARGHRWQKRGVLGAKSRLQIKLSHLNGRRSQPN